MRKGFWLSDYLIYWRFPLIFGDWGGATAETNSPRRYAAEFRHNLPLVLLIH